MGQSPADSAVYIERLMHDGYALLEGIFSIADMESVACRLSVALENTDDPSILRSRGQTYGSRNLLTTFPVVMSLMNQPALKGFTQQVLGANAGAVRALFFDKPPERSWSLPWHKDQTIAVKRNDLPSGLFQKATVKAGVPHVEAPDSVLESMLTIRIHLDAMTDANGPLHVIPGSHLDRNEGRRQPRELHARCGDVLAMRPLLSHSSTMSQPGTTSHRRVIHFEVAASPNLPDGYEWHSFVRL